MAFVRDDSQAPMLEHDHATPDWGICDVSAGTTDAAARKLLEDFQYTRTEYVGRIMHWLDFAPGQFDQDRYDDESAHTHYFIASRRIQGRERAYVGLRATPVTKVESALSFVMWDGARGEVDSPIAIRFASPEVQRFLRLVNTEIKRPGGTLLYDVTRLVPLLQVEKELATEQEVARTHEAVIRLIGAIGGKVGLESMIMFTSTPMLLHALERASFPTTLVVQGEISPGRHEGDSYLCWGHMRHAWYHLKGTRPDQALLFEEGYRAICGESPDKSGLRSKPTGGSSMQNERR